VKVQGHVAPAANAMEGGDMRSTVNSGTIEAHFMIDPNQCRNFNLCLWIRGFIVEARVMDPTFSILPLGENGGASRSRRSGQIQRRELINITHTGAE
jgi:hypothetical protein